MTRKTIHVTKPSLPPLEEFVQYLEQIWESRLLTNCGPLHEELEAALCSYLKVPFVSLFNNATVGLITALQAMELTGEVITTPFSFVATTDAIVWNRLDPVFVDIDPTSLNLDPAKIEAAITPRTTAILPVHCYGNPCDVDAIDAIAKRHKLKVLYDAAHAFGVNCHCGSVLKHGDLSVLSFHATKAFNTFEGGAIISPTAAVKKKIDQLRNFGIVNETSVNAVGMNGKMSEINAAMGLVQLRHIDRFVAARKQVDAEYRKQLKNVWGIRCLDGVAGESSNYSYFPILVEADYPDSRDGLYERLKSAGFFARRYFHPLISEFPVFNNLPSASSENLPTATIASRQILCLPLYHDLDLSVVCEIARLIGNC